MEKYVEMMGATRCPKCKSIWEHAAGKPDYKQKDDKGHVLTKYLFCFCCLSERQKTTLPFPIGKQLNILQNIALDVQKKAATPYFAQVATESHTTLASPAKNIRHIK